MKKFLIVLLLSISFTSFAQKPKGEDKDSVIVTGYQRAVVLDSADYVRLFNLLRDLPAHYDSYSLYLKVQYFQYVPVYARKPKQK
jgi:hypothetical protein